MRFAAAAAALLLVVLGSAVGRAAPASASTPATGVGGAQIASGNSDSSDSPFSTDSDYVGGVASPTYTATSVGQPANDSAPQWVYHNNRYGNFKYIVPGLTPGAPYDVRLHFAETYWSQVGQREFNVLVNGNQVLTHFDIVAAAGKPLTGVFKDFVTTAAGDGTVTVQFVAVVDNALVNGVEVTPMPIGTGGAKIASGNSDSSDSPFSTDTDYVGGTASPTYTASGVGQPLNDSAPQWVYHNSRYGNFKYVIPGLTPGAPYDVRLHFAETYWSQVGQREFNVLVNGNQVLTHFDIVAAAGSRDVGIFDDFTTTAAADGTVTVQFVTVVDNAQINGIEVTPIG